MKNAICSIVSNNYFSQVLNLCKSIRKIYDKEIEIYVLIVDKKSDQVDYSESDAHILFAHELGIENFLYYALKYNVIEFNTFLKPFLLEKLLDKHEKVVYLDPDIEIFDKLDIIYDSLENKDFSVWKIKIFQSVLIKSICLLFLMRTKGIFCSADISIWAFAQ